MTWYNPTEGTWVVSGEFATSSILAGSGIWIEDAKGSGNLLITYTASGAKVFSSGVLQFSTLMAPAGVVTLSNKGTLGSVKYHPRAFTDAEAIALATGNITVSFALRNVFNNSPQGVWYDPSDTTTLFQDSAGTTPVTASGQPVGLMLDKSKGLVRGPELVTNGTFDAGLSGWSVVAGAVASVVSDAGSNVLSLSAAGGGSNLNQSISIAAGKTIELTYSRRGVVAGDGLQGKIQVEYTDTSVATHFIANALVSGSYEAVTWVLTLPKTTSKIRLVATNASADTVGTTYFDNISVRELHGHHATQPTAASRPIYRRGDSRGVVNLLTWSEDFGNAAWVKTNSSVVANVAAAPDGSMTADKLLEATSTAGHTLTQFVIPTAGTTYQFTRRIKAGGRNFALIGLNGGGVSDFCSVNLSTGAMVSVNGSPLSFGATSLGDGWWDVRIASVASNSTTLVCDVRVSQDGTWVNRVYTGDGSSGILLHGAQLNLGPTALPYQRNDANLGGVATGASTDLHWLETDGVDDGMVTGNIDFTGTDKVSVFAGVRKMATADSVIAELSANSDTNNGSFSVGIGFIERYFSASRGTIARETAIQPVATPTDSVVLGGISSISGDSVVLRLNGAQAASSSANQGTGNYGNYPLYLFRRGGASLPFNGWFYGLAITGRLTTDAETVATERYLATKSAVVIP